MQPFPEPCMNVGCLVHRGCPISSFLEFLHFLVSEFSAACFSTFSISSSAAFAFGLSVHFFGSNVVKSCYKNLLIYGVCGFTVNRFLVKNNGEMRNWVLFFVL